MVGIIANLVVNVLIIVLLVVSIGYCWLLNKRIKILQDSRGEMARLLKHFDESTQRASESIIALQTASKKIGENIQFRIDKANYLIDDLSFMIEKGNKLANQMEAGFAVSRAREKALSEQKPAVKFFERPEPPEAEPVEEMKEEAPKPQEKFQPVLDKTSATLEAVLERVVGRNKTEVPPAEKQQEAIRSSKRSRSRSEQELLDLIKAGMKG